MTVFDQFDLMARGGAIALLALWSWLLIRDHRHALAARLAVAMNVAICCYVIVTSGGCPEFTPVGLVLALGAGSAAGLFWLFARAWFNDHQKLSRLGITLLLAALLNTLALQLTFQSGGVVSLISAILFYLNQFGFALAALWEVWRGRDGDLIEGRRRLRSALVASVAAYVALIAVVEISAQSDAMDRDAVRIVGAGAVIVIFGFCAAMMRLQQADLFGPPAPVASSALATQPVRDDPLAERLLTHIVTNLPYRDETLSIAKLAAQLDEPEYRLRRVINQQLGYRNFAQFLNSYRLVEVKNALADPAQSDVPIVTIALDAGFGSLGPFNRAFREAEGMTPSEYRVRAAG